MKLKLACADFSFPLLEHGQVLDLIALLGIEAVDIGLFEGRGHLQPSAVFASLPRSARALSRQLGDRGLAAADIFLQTAADFVSLAPNHPDAGRRRTARDMFLRALEFASRTGSRHVSCLPGVRFDEEPARVSLARCHEELAWRVEKAIEQRLVLGVEAHIGSIAPVPARAARLVEAVPGLTLTLDYTHFTLQGIPDEEVAPLLPLASHFHVRGARKGRLQASFAQNTIDYRRVLSGLAAAKYRGYMGLEYTWIDWQHCNEVDNLSETILMRRFLLAEAGKKTPARG